MSSHWTRWLFSVLSVPPILLSGCGSGGGAGMTTSTGVYGTSPATLSGVASKGPFAGASLAFHAVTSRGGRGVLMASARTDEDGRFSTPISMPATGPVWVECRVDRHRDEASQQMMSLPQSRLVTFCIPEVRPSGLTTAPLTPFNHMAFRLAMASGGVTTARMREGLASLSSAVGADVSLELPADMSTAEGVRAAFMTGPGQMPRGRVAHGMYLAAMSRRAQEMGVEPIEYMLSLGSDFEDGRMDGVDGRGQALPRFSPSELDAIRLAAGAFSSDRASQMADNAPGHAEMVQLSEAMRLGQQVVVDVTRMRTLGDAMGMPAPDSMPGAMPTTMRGGMPGMDSMPGGMPTSMPHDRGSLPGAMMTTHVSVDGPMVLHDSMMNTSPVPAPSPEPVPTSPTSDAGQPGPDPHGH